eukprot:349632-Chlamydomonas_euryale.AAC.28
MQRAGIIPILESTLQVAGQSGCANKTMPNSDRLEQDMELNVDLGYGLKPGFPHLVIPLCLHLCECLAKAVLLASSRADSTDGINLWPRRQDVQKNR